ncbi:hypothetical protein QYE76_001973 [Lolium multiflorum]|uniref:CCHC-type domain-containing protein n=1 Tax=Lolium multiflorum TaxID=4521 RepID=A0AAD8RKS7_LOLMU|nr:hypothetical protein QYE76_001973 [Lolium multiflorum]
MMQMLQMLMADREAERAERQANIAAMQLIAQNNQGHGNHDHPRSKLKNFQNTNPPVFSKTEEPLDTDDWLQTMENNLEVARVEDNDKVLFSTHYLAGPARAWWTSARALNAGQMMTWADFKLKFSKYHVPPGLIKKMRDEFRELKQGRLTVVEYRDRFLTLSRYAPDETDTTEKSKERLLNGLHDEMQTVLVNIPFADLEALVDSAIHMEGKLNQANENRKCRMMHQSGPSNTPRFRPSSSGGFTPRNNKPPMQMSRPGFQNRSGGNPRPGGHNNHNNNPHHANTNHFNRAPMRAPNNYNSNTAPRTGSNAVPITPKDKSTITCYECGVVGHYSNECPKILAKTAANTSGPAQQQRRVANGKKFTPNNSNNRNGRLFHMSAEEAQPSAGSSKKSVKTKRGKTKTLKQGVTYNIDVINATGRPLEPEANYTKFINQCGVVVRDNVPITVQEWHEPVKARVGFCFVNKRMKKECWRKLMEHFILPPEYNKYDEEGNEVEGGRQRRRLVKEFALQKMAEAFRTYKKNIADKYVKKGKTPDFNGQYKKLKDDWPKFMEPNEPINTKFYQLGNGGSLIFEHDLNALSDFLERPHPEFHGIQVDDTPGGELQWIITADLRGKMEPPTSERILFSFRESNWLDGLARGV